MPGAGARRSRGVLSPIMSARLVDIHAEPPPTPAAVSCTQLLAERAGEFLRLANTVADDPHPNSELVHDARVAGRRLAVALKLFRDFLPRNARRIRGRVRRATRALGNL